MEWISTAGSVLLYVPFILFVFVYALTYKSQKRKALGIAADVTAFLLFFSVPASIELLFGLEVQSFIFLAALLFAIFLLIREWKIQKELEVVKFLRKVWRICFLALSAIYGATWLAGLIYLAVQSFR
ncbi:DUF3397 domain-containing protein [Planococcus sp. CP5-4]|uniref:DUF3397 family protein n=1 Tax=unclassified Planococcus (in: firmicutes) TaxID=2662419 RepID=UPI001C2255B0|nr:MULTISPECIES: DUF3397 family protein [unclassified Planococcus (in: firmicutes)]MBU9672160.1 DUF3397 domain-containing protein [Planococcus sp. CP5-4_YE]MBV0907723.1 DUF3397 domain-containing protein [Planococcus sp. CP5-4_UN]MBW6062890.1 DUF3397 domain-containing protein [Planococcus sp. CP5-4]